MCAVNKWAHGNDFEFCRVYDSQRCSSSDKTTLPFVVCSSCILFALMCDAATGSNRGNLEGTLHSNRSNGSLLLQCIFSPEVRVFCVFVWMNFFKILIAAVSCYKCILLEL